MALGILLGDPHIPIFYLLKGDYSGFHRLTLCFEALRRMFLEDASVREEVGNIGVIMG